MKVFRIPMDDSFYYTKSLQDALDNLEPELERLEEGEDITVGVEEMTEEEFEALPEFNN